MKRILFITLIFLFIFGLISIAIVSYFRINERVYPHTFLFKKDVANYTSSQLLTVLQKSYNDPVQLNIRGRVYKRSYKDLGILLSTKTTLDQFFEPNRLSFPNNVKEYIHSYISQKMVMPTLLFTQDYYLFTQKKIDFSDKQDEVSVDNANKKLNFIQNTDVNIIDAEDLKKSILYHFGDTQIIIEPRLIKLQNETKQKSITDENKKIEQLFSRPIELIIQDSAGLLHKAFLTQEELKPGFQVAYDQNREGAFFIPDTQYLQKITDEKVNKYLQIDSHADTPSAVENIKAILQSRYNGQPDRVIWIKSVIGPNTKGDLANRYIEVDISQQTMYFFDSGNLLRTYKISSGLYYPTPRGHFHIINKALEGYSDIYNVWMPYWMAFYFGPEVNAYFGIHELPYWYTGDGERKQRPREFIGSPHTGGCISLDIGAAKEVYDMSYEGMDVYIYE